MSLLRHTAGTSCGSVSPESWPQLHVSPKNGKIWTSWSLLSRSTLNDTRSQTHYSKWLECLVACHVQIRSQERLIKKNLQEEGLKYRDTSCAPIYLHIFSRILPRCHAYLAHHRRRKSSHYEYLIAWMKWIHTPFGRPVKQSLSHRVLQQLFSQSQISKVHLTNGRLALASASASSTGFSSLAGLALNFTMVVTIAIKMTGGWEHFVSGRKCFHWMPVTLGRERQSAIYVWGAETHHDMSWHQCAREVQDITKSLVQVNETKINQVWLGLWCFPTNWSSLWRSSTAQLIESHTFLVDLYHQPYQAWPAPVEMHYICHHATCHYWWQI